MRELTGGRGADVTIEATGVPAAVPEGMRLTRDAGRYVVVGQYTNVGEATFNPHLDLNQKHLEIRGCWGSDVGHMYRSVQVMAKFANSSRGRSSSVASTTSLILNKRSMTSQLNGWSRL